MIVIFRSKYYYSYQRRPMNLDMLHSKKMMCDLMFVKCWD